MYDVEIEALLNREIADFLEKEYAERGDKLYQWYRYRFLAANNKALTETIGLGPHDRAIARFVIERCPFAKRFVEVGAGVGQESILLAMMGKTTCAIEANVENFTMMKRLVEHLAARLASDLPNRMTPIYDWYPTRAAEYVDSDTILAFPSLSWTLDAAQERTIFDSLSAAGGVILSLYDFFTHRAEPAEQEALVAQIRERGFEAPIEISSWEGANMGFRHDRHVFMRKSGGR